MGSFWDVPYKDTEWEELFVEDQMLLFEDIKQLPVVSATRKIGDFTKRLRSLQAYVLIINELLAQLPLSISSVFVYRLLHTDFFPLILSWCQEEKGRTDQEFGRRLQDLVSQA